MYVILCLLVIKKPGFPKLSQSLQCIICLLLTLKKTPLAMWYAEVD